MWPKSHDVKIEYFAKECQYTLNRAIGSTNLLLLLFSGGSRNSRTEGHGFLNAPLHIPYAFVVRVNNKIQFVSIACWLQ